MEGTALVGAISQMFARHKGSSESKEYGSICLLLSAINALEKNKQTNKKLKVTNYQFRAKYNSEKASLVE